MKTLLSFLMILFVSCATTSLFAQSEGYVGIFEFPAGDAYLPISYTYDLTDATACEPLVKNEIYRVCIVRDKRSASADFTMTVDTTPAVSIDAAGQLVLGENASSAKWLDLYWTVAENGVATVINADYITAGDVAGLPSHFLYTLADGSASYYGFNASTTEDLPSGEGSVYVYLVAMDTRMGTGECEGKPYHVKAYAMALCPKSSTEPEMTFNTARRTWLVGGVGTATTVYWPGYSIPWQPASPITSLTVTQNDTQITLTGDELKAYLTPELTALTQDESGTLSLTATAPDVQYYTLYTKSALSDAEWTSFEDFVTNNKNVLDNLDGKDYTRFRIDGESPLEIPVIAGEASRFYMLRGE